MSVEHQSVANELEKAAEELEVAAKHLRVASGHFKATEVPRGCAHAFACLGHLTKAKKIIDSQAEVHSSKAKLQ